MSPLASSSINRSTPASVPAGGRQSRISGGVESFVARRAAMRTSSRRAPMTSRPRPMGGTGSVGGEAVVRSARLAFVEVSVSE